jgi:FAD synthetase
MTKVMCFGTFDLFHLGHLNYFKQAKTFGDYLIVIIARDKTKISQAKEAVFTESERLELIESLMIVDEVILGNEEDHFKVIEEHSPDVICLGYDHQIEEITLREKLAERNLHPKIIRLKPYQENKHKSTKIKEKVLNQ